MSWFNRILIVVCLYLIIYICLDDVFVRVVFKTVSLFLFFVIWKQLCH